jgi:hypothetical protein
MMGYLIYKTCAVTLAKVASDPDRGQEQRLSTHVYVHTEVRLILELFSYCKTLLILV